MDKILKVCKIDSLSFARYALQQDVDFFGVHILDVSEIGKHFELINFLKENKCKVIIVTKIKNFDDLQNLLSYYTPAGLQLHYQIETDLSIKINTSFPNILLFGVITDDAIFKDYDLIGKYHDYIIYDTSYRGGTNTLNSYHLINDFPDALKRKTLLAGGITTEAIRNLHCIESVGYDIQSFFKHEGKLNFQKLEAVCDLIKPNRKNKITVSLTDIPLLDIQQAASYYSYPILDYHVDLSPGKLYQNFITINKSIEEKLQFLHQLPFSIHLFIDNEEDLHKLIMEFSDKYKLSLTRIFVQYKPGINLSKIIKESLIKIIPSVYHKELASYLESNIEHPYLSIIVPDAEHKESLKDLIAKIEENKHFFSSKEIWFDRNLNLEYIKILSLRLQIPFNVVIGKEVINNWKKITEINEYFFK